MYGDTRYCRGCGEMLKFIRTQKGGLMPCGSWPVRYIPDENGRLLYKENGEAVKGRIVDPKLNPAAPLAWEPHWAKCPNPPPRKEKKKAPTAPRVRYASAEELMEIGRRKAAQKRAREEYERRVREEIQAREKEWAERQMTFRDLL